MAKAQGLPVASLKEGEGDAKPANPSNAESSTGSKVKSGSGDSDSDEEAYSSDEDYLSNEDEEEDDDEEGEGEENSDDSDEAENDENPSSSSKHTGSKEKAPFKAKESEDLLEITEVRPDVNRDERSGSNSESESGDLSEDEKLEDEDDVDPGGVSSSKSMTSSATSFAQFSKSIKALVNYETSKLKKYVNWFKITLIMTIIILIVTSIVSFDIISASIAKHDEFSAFVNEVGDMRYYTQSLSYYARILSLMDSGYVTATDRDDFI
jgi:hypothetical protein